MWKYRLIVNNELTILLGSIKTNYKLVNYYSLSAKTSYKTSIDNKIVQPETIWFKLISQIITTTITVEFKVLI